MNKKKQIEVALPKIKRDKKESISSNSPIAIMQMFGELIDSNYKGYLKSLIVDTTRIESNSKPGSLSYSFYIIAFIGKGYHYKLFEVVPKRVFSPYPVELILFQNHPSKGGVFNTELSFQRKLKSFFESSFFSNVVYNLSSQVDLFNEIRGDKKLK